MKRGSIILLLAVLLLIAPVTAWAETVSSAALVEEPAEWDGRTVTFTGEAIGEAMVRGDEVWLHVNDDAYAAAAVEENALFAGYNSGQAIVASAGMADVISVFGDHRHRGDLVEVTGVFNAACPRHGGDMDLHATGIRVLVAGWTVEHAPARGKLVLLGATALFAALATLSFARRRSRI